MKLRFYLIPVLIILFCPEIITAQENGSYFSAGVNYVSNNVYLGRKDSVTIPYISPYVEYHNKTGIYGNLMASYLPVSINGRSPDFDLLTLEGGYMHDFFDDHLSGILYFDKYWY